MARNCASSSASSAADGYLRPRLRVVRRAQGALQGRGALSSGGNGEWCRGGGMIHRQLALDRRNTPEPVVRPSQQPARMPLGESGSPPP
jgi:hypothetical protein